MTMAPVKDALATTIANSRPNEAPNEDNIPSPPIRPLRCLSLSAPRTPRAVGAATRRARRGSTSLGLRERASAEK